MACRPGVATLLVVDLEQLQAECFELVDDAVQGGLVGERPAQHGVLSPCAGGQRWKRLEDRRADRTAHPDLVVARRSGSIAARCFGAGTRSGLARGWVSARHAVLVNPPKNVHGIGANMSGRGGIRPSC